MKLVFPFVNDPKFIDFIYQEELLNACIQRAKDKFGLNTEMNLIDFFLKCGKENRITQPLKLHQFITRFPVADVNESILYEAVKIWHVALGHAALVQTEYELGLKFFETVVLRRFRVLNDDTKYHVLIGRVKLGDLADRTGADFLALFDPYAGRDYELYHGATGDELMFNMFFGFTSQYPRDKLKLNIHQDQRFIEALNIWKRDNLKPHLLSNITTVREFER